MVDCPAENSTHIPLYLRYKQHHRKGVRKFVISEDEISIYKMPSSGWDATIVTLSHNSYSCLSWNEEGPMVPCFFKKNYILFMDSGEETPLSSGMPLLMSSLTNSTLNISTVMVTQTSLVKPRPQTTTKTDVSMGKSVSHGV